MPQTVVTAYSSNEKIDSKTKRFHSRNDVGSQTSGVSFQGIRPKGGGLRPSMVDERLKLNLDKVIMAPGTTDDAVQLQIRQSLVSQAIDSCFPGLYEKVFGQGQCSEKVFPMPVVELVEIPMPEKLEKLDGLPFDGYTEEGTEHVIEEIYLNNYKLEDHDFYDKVFMLFTDQRTVENIRIMKFLHDEDEDFGYATKKWLLPFPSLMHTRMHALEMLQRGHFGGDPKRGGSLYNHLQFLQIPNISEDVSDFFALEELVIQSYRVRILSFIEEKFELTPQELFDKMKEWKPQQLQELVQEITNNITNRANWNTFDESFHNDQEVQAHYLFLRHSEVYYVLKHAIKAGDIGLLKRAISMCCLQFHGSGQSNYAYQMLHMIRYVIAETIPKEIQRVLLINTITHARIFESECIGKHPTAEPEQINKLWQLASRMFEHRSSRITPGRLVTYPAKNLAHEGRLNLSNDRVRRFNRKEVDKIPDDEYPEEDTLEGHFDVYLDTTTTL